MLKYLAWCGQTANSAVVFQNIDELQIDDMPKEITLFSQTTKSVNDFHSDFQCTY